MCMFVYVYIIAVTMYYCRPSYHTAGAYSLKWSSNSSDVFNVFSLHNLLIVRIQIYIMARL